MHSYTVSLRIESSTLDVSRVTEDLGIAPTQTRAAGQYRSPTSVFEKALWEFDLVPEELDVAFENRPAWPQWESLEAAFKKLLSIFSKHVTVLGDYGEHHQVYLWVGHFSSSFDGGPRLSAEILKALGNFGVPVWVDTHFIDDEYRSQLRGGAEPLTL
jgi:hypothetical protein